jgi:hypothetical protein
MKYSKDKSCWKPKTTIVVCKGVDKFAGYLQQICILTQELNIYGIIREDGRLRQITGQRMKAG